MHPYEQHILRILAYGEKKRYKDLKPPGSESNLFTYHLKGLIRKGLIQKMTPGYALTARGNRYVDELSLPSLQPRFQPKIVTLIVCRNRAGEYLIWKRGHQPFFGCLAFPYGKIHFGETVREAAARELMEKAGLKAKLTERGMVHLTIYKDGELMTDMLCFVFKGAHPSGSLREKSDLGTFYWGTLEKAAAGKFIPGFTEIARLALRSGDSFFLERTLTSDGK